MASNGVIHEINGVLMPEGAAEAAAHSTAPHGDALDLVATVSHAGNFTKLVAAIEAAGLVETLQGVGPFTVLAPTDAAFEALPAGTLDTLLKPDNKQKLVDLLMYHVIMTKAVAADIASLNGRTANTGLTGKKLNISVDGDAVMINGNVKVTAADIMATNGVIHEINGVLIADGKSTVAGDSGTAHAAGGAGAAHGKTKWSYEGETGPAMWGTLSQEYSTCSTGMSQSPIDIKKFQPIGLEDITFNYQPEGMKVVNNGHTIQANIDAGSSITLDSVTFNLLQFHFHTPSEHTLLGRALPMEMHLVHKDADGHLAVVGVLINVGAANANYSEIWSHMPAVADEEQPVPAPLNPVTLLPKDRRAYRYSGSLTTPPCSEGVNWLLLANPIQMSNEQIAAFKMLFPLNARPVQPLHDRPVLVDITIGG
jgi:carbonic anhydrase